MKKSKPKKKVTKNEQKIQTPVPSPEKEEDPFDFGGMPKRDLKKNLGCG